MNLYRKILKFTAKDDPRAWWREYPPKFIDKDKTLSCEEIKKYLRVVFRRGTEEKIGVYVHVPFCLSRCHFCKFYSGILKDRSEMDEFLDYLEKELRFYETDFKNAPIDSFYIGGGTPTILDDEQWKRLFRIVHSFFVFKKNAQIATEGTPETSFPAKLKLLKRLGLNRFTIGVQSFDDKVLKKANRKHCVKDVYRAVKAARQAGIACVNLDLMLGLAGETWDSYSAMLRGIAELKPDCVSILPLDWGYLLNPAYEKETRKSAYFNPLLQPRVFSYLWHILEKTGYERSRGSSDSIFILRERKGSANINLLNRMKLGHTFGLGRFAESSLGPLKYHISPNGGDYFLRINAGKLPRFVGTKLTKDEHIRRYFIYNFIHWGKISKKDFKKQFGEEADSVMDKKFSELKKDKRIFDVGGDLIFLTDLAMGKKISKYPEERYTKRERNFLFCVKYFFSPPILDHYKEYFEIHR